MKRRLRDHREVLRISVFVARDVTLHELAQQPSGEAVVRDVVVNDDGQVHFTILPGSVGKNRISRTDRVRASPRRGPPRI